MLNEDACHGVFGLHDMSCRRFDVFATPLWWLVALDPNVRTKACFIREVDTEVESSDCPQ